MNLQFVKYFLVLSSTENFTNGAKQLNVVQSTFSAGIKKLEEHLNVQLFERNNRSVKLTKHGLAFLPKAKKIINQWTDIEHSFNIYNTEAIKIGFVQNISISDVLQYVNDFKKENSLSRIDILEEKDNKLFELLKKGEIDAFFSDSDENFSDLEQITVATEKLYIAININHSITKKSVVKLQDLGQLPFIERSQCLLQNEVYRELSKRKVILKKSFTAHNNETVLALVSANMGFALMPKPFFEIPEIKFISIHDAFFYKKISLFWKNNYRKIELSKFISLVQKTTQNNVSTKPLVRKK